jgi:hypothetical protein
MRAGLLIHKSPMLLRGSPSTCDIWSSKFMQYPAEQSITQNWDENFKLVA